MNIDKIMALAEPQPVAAWEEKYGMKEWEVLALRAGWAPQPKAEQPAEQEPIAWGMMDDAGRVYDCITPEEHARCEGEYTVPLYAAPRPAIPPGYKLVPVEPTEAMKDVQTWDYGMFRPASEIWADMLEAALEAPRPKAEQEPVALPSAVRKAAYDQIDRFIRNNLHDDDYADYSAALDSLYTAPQPKAEQQEPRFFWDEVDGCLHEPNDSDRPDGCIPLYTSPQPRREVELTDEEIFAVENNVPDEVIRYRDWAIWHARAVIAAYKAKQGETNG